MIYGPKHPGDQSIFDTSPYLLPQGDTTPPDWDCDGFFVPNDRFVEEPFRRARKGPLAVKFWDYRHFTVTARSVGVYGCATSNGRFEPSQINWPIPNFSYDQLMRKGVK